MLMLAFVSQALVVRKPTLDAGVFAYAKAGFGDYAGFIAAIGFWARGGQRVFPVCQNIEVVSDALVEKK